MDRSPPSAVRDGHGRGDLIALLADLPVHPTPFEHWLRVGSLRHRLSSHGVTVSTPDAHVAQCALDRDSYLLSRDQVFGRIAGRFPLRVLGS